MTTKLHVELTQFISIAVNYVTHICTSIYIELGLVNYLTYNVISKLMALWLFISCVSFWFQKGKVFIT